MLWLRLLLSPSLSDDIASYKKVFAKTQFQKIKNALNVYFLKTGNYPVSLEDLVYAGLIKKDDLTYPGGVKYGYHLQADGGYRLEDAPL
jgi:competence protein ComGC